MTTFLESDEELVLLTSCADTAEASLVRSLLEAHGLTALVQGEHHHAMQGMMSELQEVRILVKRKHLAEAQAVLDASSVPDEEPASPPPSAGSTIAPAPGPAKLEAPDTRRARRRKRLAWAVLIFPFVPFLIRLFEQDASSRRTEVPSFADDHLFLGEVLRHLRRYGEAELHLRKAIALYRQRFAASERQAASLQLAAVLLEWERPVLAVSALEEELRAIPGSAEESPERYLRLEALALAHRFANQHEEAVKVARRALALGERLHGEAHPELLDLLETYAGALRALGRGEEALVLEARQQRSSAQQVP
ncbi:tetratricopeptide repeat protein [Archangium minus]|uniref:Tetratricopeptide repeat protein n=1 Tax=Archangium minus TaxID=83450 RepID=A0ABY9X9G2_9BACT|nr:tetratricopeptide repeat protein [Archangium minus]